MDQKNDPYKIRRIGRRKDPKELDPSKDPKEIRPQREKKKTPKKE